MPPEIYIPGKELVSIKPVIEVEGVSVFADDNTRGILTGEFTGADELTDVNGLTYRELNEILLR